MQHYQNFAESMEQLFYSNSNEKVILTSLIQKMLGQKTFKNGLDIGAGPGLITQPLADRCQNLSLIEPLMEHANILKNKYINAHIYPGLLKDFRSKEQFDFILCAHMLCYLHSSEFLPTIIRIVNLLALEGELLLINSEADFIFRIFSEKLSNQFKVFSPKTAEIMDILSSYGQYELITSSFEKTFFNDQEILSYLAKYLTVSEEVVLACPSEIEQFKKLLKREGAQSILTHTNSLIYFKKQSV